MNKKMSLTLIAIGLGMSLSNIAATRKISINEGIINWSIKKLSLLKNIQMSKWIISLLVPGKLMAKIATNPGKLWLM